MKLGVVLAVVVLAGCAETGRGALDGGPHDLDYCTDEDGDGFGEGCAPGGDCNDTDPTIHQGCLSCVRPADGCACDNSDKPVSCYLEPSSTDDGTIMCHEGTRYCRSGSWSACESIFSYPKPAAAEQTQAVINPSAGLEKCSDCRPNCFLVRDNLNPVDGGLGSSGSQTKVSDGGGLSLDTYEVDAGAPMDAGKPPDAATCMVGAAPDKDCDGILDQYDPYPTKKPFATTNPTLFLDLAAGATGTGAINLAFYLNSADVYFLLDQTGSMGEERAQLVKDLTTGTFITDASYKCSDYDYNGSPNNELKDQGIVGAVRCYIRDANFGVGFFREIPFDARPSPWYKSFYGPNDEIAFRNLQDITTDLTKISAGASKLKTQQNIDWEEAAMPALYSLASGNGMYFGTTKPSISARADCPADTWGYPCFRKDAIPIVVLFTDAPSHNGPTTNTFPYNSNYLDITSNTAGTITWVSGNETFATATDTGNLTNRYVSFAGDTSTMASNLGTSAFTCAASGSAPDAFFKFTLDSAKTVTLTTDNSFDAVTDSSIDPVPFDTVLGLWRGTPSSSTAVATNPSGNDAFGNAYNFTDVTNKWVSATGNTSALNSDYLANDLGCSAYSGSPDAAFKFTVSQPTRIALDTAGSSINTSVSLFSGTPIVPSYKSVTSAIDTLASPYGVGPINGLLNAYSGTTDAPGVINANYTAAQIGCGTADGSPDAVYEFTVTGSGTTKVRVSAEDSTLDTVLALVDNGGTTYKTATTVTSSGNDTIASATALGALEGKSFTMNGDTNGLAKNYDPTLFPGCDAGDTRDSVTSFSLTSTKTVRVSTTAVTGGIDTVIGLFKGAISAAPSGFVACNDDAAGTSSSITQTLGMGTYYVVVKAKNGTSPTRGQYGLTVLDTAAAGATTLACDYSSGPNLTSAIERDLTAGTYRVVVKGKTASDKGKYKLQIRDLSLLPAGMGRLACNYNGGTGGKSYLEQDLPMGTYTVLLKGDSASASGNYKLSVRDASNLAASQAPLYCNNDASGKVTSQLVNLPLSMGTYYVGVKGNTATASGRYQVHFGAGATTTKKYVPPTWATTIAELKAKKVRVIPILSCKDDPDHGDAQGDCKTARTQYTALANATGALGQSLAPLIFDINAQGIGLSGTVVQGIASLAQYLEMNVSARVVFGDVDPTLDVNPGFSFSIKAVDAPSDGCDGIVGAEHQKCLPGATPRFEISFTNPLAAPVPLNSLAKDPKGGYNFRAELIANDEFIVDSVPIYIIPEAVVNVPPPPRVYANGTYTQTLSGDGCSGRTELPDWNELSWSATVPNGTSVSFAACGSQNPMDLATCTTIPLCTITGGNLCSATSPCPTGSFCSAAGNCNKITGGACSSNASCASGATCVSNVCTWDRQPVDVGELLGSKNGQPNLRVTIGLTANTTTNVGPTVKDWSLNYLCKNSL